MSDATMETMVKEILQRSVRIESRLVMVADHAGLDVRPRKVAVTVDKDGRLGVAIEALDVSLSRITQCVQESREWSMTHPGRYTIPVVFVTPDHESVVASITLQK